MRAMLIFLTSVVTFALGCGGAPTAAAVPKSTSAFAPTPYTAEQLQAAMPVGHIIRVRIEAGGQPPMEQIWEVTATTPEACTIVSRTVDATGATLATDPPQTSRWDELRDHAKFPAAATVITDRYHYVVTQPDGTVETYDFSPDHAGPPLLLVATKDGKQLVRFETLERR